MSNRLRYLLGTVEFTVISEMLLPASQQASVGFCHALEKRGSRLEGRGSEILPTSSALIRSKDYC